MGSGVLLLATAWAPTCQHFCDFDSHHLHHQKGPHSGALLVVEVVAIHHAFQVFVKWTLNEFAKASCPQICPLPIPAGLGRVWTAQDNATRLPLGFFVLSSPLTVFNPHVQIGLNPQEGPLLNQEEIERVHEIVRDSVLESGMHLGILKKIREELGDKAVKTGISVMEAWSRTPEGLEAKQRMEASFHNEIMEKERARREAKEQREQEWRMVHAYRWLIGPVPVWDEDEEKVIFVPLTEDIVEVEAIRSCSREWEAGDRSRPLHAHLFDHIAQFNMDWENIVRRENRLAMEFIDGAPFNNRDEAYDL